jgi:hypothetical protein
VLNWPPEPPEHPWASWPVGEEEESSCCDDPTPAVHEGRPYCQACDADLDRFECEVQEGEI